MRGANFSSPDVAHNLFGELAGSDGMWQLSSRYGEQGMRQNSECREQR